MNTNSISKLAMLGLACALPPVQNTIPAEEMISTVYGEEPKQCSWTPNTRSYNDAISRRASRNRKKNKVARAARKRNRT